jgi:hypothetical protein
MICQKQPVYKIVSYQHYFNRPKSELRPSSKSNDTSYLKEVLQPPKLLNWPDWLMEPQAGLLAVAKLNAFSMPNSRIL